MAPCQLVVAGGKWCFDVLDGSHAQALGRPSNWQASRIPSKNPGHPRTPLNLSHKTQHLLQIKIHPIDGLFFVFTPNIVNVYS